jgi:hypothetical protein
MHCVHEMNAYRADRVSVCPIHPENRWADLDETRYGRSDIAA